MGFMSKTTTLHVHHAFLFISSPFLHNNGVKWPNFKLTWELERQGAKFYYLCLNLDAIPSLKDAWRAKGSVQPDETSLLTKSFAWTSSRSPFEVVSYQRNLNRECLINSRVLSKILGMPPCLSLVHALQKKKQKMNVDMRTGTARR